MNTPKTDRDAIDVDGSLVTPATILPLYIEEKKARVAAEAETARYQAHIQAARLDADAARLDAEAARAERRTAEESAVHYMTGLQIAEIKINDQRALLARAHLALIGAPPAYATNHAVMQLVLAIRRLG